MNPELLKRVCASKKQCKGCRSHSAAKRLKYGLPEKCPYGYTRNNLPDPSKPNKTKPKRQRCPLATRTCCGSPDICSVASCDCYDPFNTECVHRGT